MSDNISSVVVSFGAAVDDKTFKQSLTRLRNFMAEFAQEMKKNRPNANTKIFDDFVKKADETLGKKGRLAKDIKEGMVNALNSVKSNKYFKIELDKQAKEIADGNAAILAKQKEANKKQEGEAKRSLAEKKKLNEQIAAEAKKFVDASAASAASSGTVIKAPSKSGAVGVSGAVPVGEAEATLTAFEKKLNTIRDKFDADLQKNPYLTAAYKGTIGRAETKGEMSALIAAERDFQKYATAAFQFEKVGGKYGFKASEADFSRIFQAISDKSIRFDKDIGFFSTNFQAASKALGITVDGFLAIQNKMSQGVDILGKIKMMDAKYGTTGIESAQKLQKTYQDPNVYAPALYKTMKAEQQPWYQKLGVMGDTAAVANAALQGNIDLTSRSLKVNNDLGLKALKIDEDRAIKLGILTKEYGGNAFQIQELNKKINKLSPEYKKVFDALNTNMKDPASIKRSLDVVKWTSDEVARLRDAGKAYDTLTVAMEKQQKVLAGKQTEPKTSKSAFDRVYDSQLFNTDAAKSALTKYSQVFAEKGSADMARALPVFKQVEAEIRKQSLALIAAGRDGKFFADTFDRVSAVNGILSGSLKITSKGFESVADQLNPLQKLMLKYEGSSEQLKSAISRLSETEKIGTLAFKEKERTLVSHEKKITDTIEKMKALGKTEQEILTFRGTADPMTQAFNSRSDAAKKTASTMREVAAEYKKTEQHASLLGRAIKDLYEKFKILAGYAISGSIAYGIGNALKGVIVGVIQYDQSLKDLQAITQATSYETELMGEKIKEVATKTKFSVIEVADGMKVLGQAGLTASESMEAIMPIAELATATLSDFGTINDLVSSALGAFDLQAKDTGKVVDVFGAAINRSKLDVEKLRVAMNYVGPVAHDAGLSLEEVVAGMGLFSNAGLRASTIGTAFRQIISQLMTPSKEFEEAIKRAGYTLDEMNPRTNEFSEIITKLVDVVPDAENAFKFFGQRGASAVSVLTKAGKEGFEEMTKQMGQIGSVSEMAAKQLEGMAVIAKQTKDTLQVMSLETADVVGVTDVLRMSLEFFRDTLQDIRYVLGGNGEALVGWVGFILAAVTAVGALSGALTGLAQTSLGMSVLGGIAGSFGAIKTAALLAASAVTTFFASLGPVGWAIAGITAMVGAWKVYDMATRDTIETNEDLLRQLDKQIEKTKTDNKITEMRIQYAENLNDVVRDSKQPLEERIHAYNLLIEAGADLDGGILSNIQSVEDFESALKRTGGQIDIYIEKLRGMGEAQKSAILRTLAQKAKIAKENIAKSDAQIGKPVMDDSNYITVFGLLDPVPEDEKEKIDAVLKAREEKRRDDVSTVETFNAAMVDDVKRLIEDNDAMKNKITELKAEGKLEEVKDLFAEVFWIVGQKHGLDPQDVQEATKNFIANEASVNEALLAFKEVSNKRIGKIEEIVNPNEKRDVAQQNIQNAKNLIERKKKMAAEGLRLIKELKGDDAADEEVKRISQSEKQILEETHKDVQKNLEIIKKSIDEDLNAAEEIANQDVAVAKRVAAESGSRADEKKAELLELNAEMNLAKQKMDKYAELAAYAKSTGLAKEKYLAELNSLQQKAITDYEKAKTNYASGMRSLGKKDAQDAEKELSERLKSLHKIYQVEKETFEAQEAAELAENAKINHNNLRTAQDEEYRIRMEYAEKRLNLARKLEAEERAIKAAGGKEGFMGQKEVQTITKDQTEVQSARDLDILDQKRADFEETRNLEWEFNELRLQDVMDLNEQLRGLESIEHQRRMTELGEQLLDEKITYDNYLKSVENENLRHGQRMTTIDRQIKDARIANQMEVVSGIGDLMGELYSISGEKAKAFFYAQKAMVVTEMIMNAYRTWSNAMATPNVSPIFNIPMANIMLGLGLAKAGLVAGLTIGQAVKGFAEGGEITGNSPTPTADNIPIMATAGEYMQPVPTVKYYGKGVMEALRTRSIPREALISYSKSSSKSGGVNFAEGGSIEKTNENEKSTKDSLQIVNIVDPSMFDQYVASHAGQKAIMNVISRNPTIIKNTLR